jgi:HAD superfamily hydrolase (TIGR01509 family)
VAGAGEKAFGLVIFDNDGVVVDSEAKASQAMSATLGSFGFAVTPEECDKWLKGGTLTRTRELLEERFGRPLPAQFESTYTGNVFKLFAAGLEPVRGVEAVLDVLARAGVPYCLASSGRRERVLFALEKAGMAARFAGRWWGAEDVKAGKPAPDIFLLAAERMGVPPRDCAVVEDSEVGVTAARAAGMAVFGYAARTPATALAQADAIFTDMAQLPGLLLRPGSPREDAVRAPD